MTLQEFHLASSTRNQIPIRIVLQCADADSRLALSDENDRTPFFDEERAGRLEKFRPYGLPTAEQIAAWGAKLKVGFDNSPIEYKLGGCIPLIQV
jgi:hypothetical protein